MTQMDLQDALPQMPELVKRAKSGEEIVLAEDGKPVAKLIPADANPRLKVWGMYKGQIWTSDDFHKPLTNEELKDWGL